MIGIIIAQTLVTNETITINNPKCLLKIGKNLC